MFDLIPGRGRSKMGFNLPRISNPRSVKLQQKAEKKKKKDKKKQKLKLLIRFWLKRHHALPVYYLG